MIAAAKRRASKCALPCSLKASAAALLASVPSPPACSAADVRCVSRSEYSPTHAQPVASPSGQRTLMRLWIRCASGLAVRIGRGGAVPSDAEHCGQFLPPCPLRCAVYSPKHGVQKTCEHLVTQASSARSWQIGQMKSCTRSLSAVATSASDQPIAAVCLRRSLGRGFEHLLADG